MKKKLIAVAVLLLALLLPVTALAGPAEITSFTVSASNGTVTLTWKCSEAMTGFQIQRMVEGEKYVHIATVKGSVFTWKDTQAPEGKVLTYRVRGYKKLADGTTQRSDYSAGKETVAFRKQTITLTNLLKGITVEWTPVAGVDRYYLYRDLNGNGYTRVKTADASTTRYTDTTTAPGDKVKYAVRPVIKTAEGKLMNGTLSAQVTYRLAQPALLKVAPNSKGLKLTWEKLPAANGYLIYRSTNGSSYKKVGETSGAGTRTWTDTTAKSGTVYYYKIKAEKITSAQTIYSTSSNVVKATAVDPPKVTAGNGPSGITVSFTAVPGATNYKLYRKDADGTETMLKSFTAPPEKGFVDKPENGQVIYRVVVTGSVNGMSYSFTSPSLKTQRLDVPEFTLKNNTSSISVVWDPNVADGAEIYRAAGDGSFSYLGTFARANGVYSDAWSYMTSGTKYRYKIRLYQTLPGGTKIYSSTSEPQTIVRMNPSALKEAKVTADGIALSWTPAEGAAGYRIYRTLQGGAAKLIKTVSGRFTNTWTDTGAVSGKTYTYTVRAYKTLNSVKYESADSNARTRTFTPDKPDSSYKGRYVLVIWKGNQTVAAYRSDNGTTYDKTQPVMTSLCSTGLGDCETPNGTFHISAHYRYKALLGAYGQYCCRFNGGRLFHSVPIDEIYKTVAEGQNHMNLNSYGLLGKKASHGCCRLPVGTAYWIYSNCVDGTTVIVTDSSCPTGRGAALPDLIRSTPYITDKTHGWDPTDPSSLNPYKK